MHLLNNDPQLIRQAASPSQRKFSSTYFVYPLIALFSVIILAGCIVQTPAKPAAAGSPTTNAITNTVATLPDNFNGAVEELSGYALPTSAPTSTAKLSVLVSAGGSRANIRSGPGASFPIVSKAAPGIAFTVVSKSQDGSWWQICCITGLTNTITSTAWVASSVVRVAGASDAVPVSESLLKPNLTAQWQVDWKCASERCQVKQCSAVVDVKAAPSTNQPWLSMNHRVTWNDTCFAKDSWVFEVDPTTGKERTGEYNNNFLYSYWRGKQPGTTNGVYTLNGGRSLAVWCSGPYKVEIEEGSGWTTSYQGNTCHDVRTGLLVLLSYNKRWLFTGQYQGQTYDHAYFGDSETLEQKLTDTNSTLSWVQKK